MLQNTTGSAFNQTVPKYTNEWVEQCNKPFYRDISSKISGTIFLTDLSSVKISRKLNCQSDDWLKYMFSDDTLFKSLNRLYFPFLNCLLVSLASLSSSLFEPWHCVLQVYVVRNYRAGRFRRAKLSLNFLIAILIIESGLRKFCYKSGVGGSHNNFWP